MLGVRKRISGGSGETAMGPFPGFRFDVVGLSLRYRPPLDGFIDELEPSGGGYAGRATFRGREYGRFTLERVASDDFRT